MQGCIVSALIIPFTVSVMANLATPYLKKLNEKIISKIKSHFKEDAHIESNILPLMDAIHYAPTTIIVNGDVNIISNNLKQ